MSLRTQQENLAFIEKHFPGFTDAYNSHVEAWKADYAEAYAECVKHDSFDNFVTSTRVIKNAVTVTFQDALVLPLEHKRDAHVKVNGQLFEAVSMELAFNNVVDLLEA